MKPAHKKSPEELEAWRTARAVGVKTYKGGMCSVCHHPEQLWYACKGTCVECIRIKSRESKRRNKGENIGYRDCQCPKCGGNRWYLKANKCVDCYEKIVNKRTATKRANIAAQAEKIMMDADSMAMILAKPWGYWSSSQVSTTV